MTLIFIPPPSAGVSAEYTTGPLAIDCPRPLLYNRARHGDRGIGHSKTAGGDDEQPDPEHLSLCAGHRGRSDHARGEGRGTLGGGRLAVCWDRQRIRSRPERVGG